MKNKLITILGSCSALAATIAPVSLTLSGCGSVTISWSKGETYIPMTPKDITESFKEIDDVTVAYHDDLVNNKKIWCDDKIYQFYVLNQDESETYNIQKMSCTIRKVGDVEKYTRPEGIISKIFRVDFDLKMTADITYEAIEKYKVNLELNNRRMKFRNLPVMAFYNSTDSKMFIHVNVTMMYTDKQWSVNYPKLIIDSEAKTVSMSSENETYSYDNWDAKTGSVLAGLIQETINMKTNYFSNAKVG